MLKHLIFDSIFRIFFKLLSAPARGKIIPHMLQLVNPVYAAKKNGKDYLFYTPNPLTRSRGETLFTKEPETIEWIDSFEKDSIYFDIGANVGVYSVYAGVSRPDLKIFSFEPTFFNFWLLNKNIYLNQLASRVSAICMALSNDNLLDYIYMPEIQDGGAMVNFGSNLDYNKERFKPEFTQGALAMKLDSLMEYFNFPVPNYIKIDVDGLEKEIIQGAIKTISNPGVKSILIELNNKISDDMDLINIIKSCGFNLVEIKQGEGMAKDPNFSSMHNYIFKR